jgi:hypothetical protein
MNWISVPQGQLGATYKILITFYNFHGTRQGQACRKRTLTLVHNAADNTANQKIFLYYTKINQENRAEFLSSQQS